MKAADLLTKQQTLLQPPAAQKNATRASYHQKHHWQKWTSLGDFGKEGLTIAAESVPRTRSRRLGPDDPKSISVFCLLHRM